jgi:signal transduction histidine kinase
MLALVSPAAAATLELNQAEFVASEASQPPADAAPWTRQMLPDQWRANHPEASGLWYRFRFEFAEADTQIHAVHLPRFSMNAAVYLNGVFLGSGGHFEEPVSRNWNRPRFFLIPPGLLRQGQNTLHVRVFAPPNTQGGLSPVLVGPEAALRPEYERDFFLHITLNQTASLIIAAVGVLMLSLWWRRRRDTMYGYFGVSALVWALNSTNLYVQEIPVSTRVWEILVNATFQVFAVLFLISLLRFIEARHGLLERLLWTVLAASPITMALIPSGGYMALTVFLHLMTLAAAATTLILLMRAAVRRRDADTGLLAGGMWLIVLFAAHDWLLHSKLLWYGKTLALGQSNVYLLQFGAPVLFLVVGWIMTARFVRVLNEYERLNVELEDRVAAKHAELSANFVRLQAVEKERAVLEERERLMADMHDGLGGQLLTALRSVETDRAGQVDVPQLLRECLDEMRLVVHSLASEHGDLLTVLSDLRYRFDSRLAKAGIALEWRVQDVPPLADLSPRTALDIQRIVQEALTNIIKHAQASRITVETGVAESGTQAYVRIADNGHGVRGEHRGRGLINMDKRAQRIGGAMRMESGDGGTVVTLLLPLAGTAAL